jgi:hypothetical protein
MANGGIIDRAMDAEIGIAAAAIEIHRPRAEGVIQAARQTGGIFAVKIGAGADHVGGRLPGRPFRLATNHAGAGKAQALAAHSDGIAHGAIALLDKIELAREGIDDNRARSLIAEILDLLTRLAAPEKFLVHLRDEKFAVLHRLIARQCRSNIFSDIGRRAASGQNQKGKYRRKS